MERRSTRLWIFLSLTAGACTTSGGDMSARVEAPRGRECGGPIEFVAESRRRITSSPALTGLSQSPSGDVIYWGPSLGLFLLRSGDVSPRSLHNADGASITAAFVPGGISAILGTSPRVVTFSPAGKPLATASTGLNGPVDAAVFSRDRWLTLTRESDGGPQLAVIDKGRKPKTFDLSRFIGKDRDVVVDIRPDGAGGIVITQRAWPFTVFIVSRDGQVTRLANITDHPALATVAQSRNNWLSLPALDIGCGFVQTLTDVTSTRRLLILRNVRGEVTRSNNVTATFGFVESRLTDSVLVAVSTLDFREVVAYRWRVRH